jgi:uncharacterized lipoprotein YddW (UPF0748 family)/predicted glycoside hydrolase/deacetylase ChbG (UPF0249 family)
MVELKQEVKPDLPVIPREFRAAWVATVANINWPSERGLPTSEQKQEAIYLLDLLKRNNFNAVIFQVRPQCDALYASELEPWSYFLSGVQGQPPDPYYDPLEFWIMEAHKRGLELHAWLNPYRAHHVSGGEITAASIVRRKPQLTVELKGGYWWLDPSLPETQEHSLAVAMDIVNRYDIDGIHMDDYFYPYPSYNENEDFPDDSSWQVYQSLGGELARDDWRRESVNIFIQNLYTHIKKKKPYVKFGISPFGIWRPHHPPSIRGFDQYAKLYADARLWLNEGWMDYWTPQLYWPIKQIPQSYPVLLGWWSQENKKNRHIWPGINIGRPWGEEGIVETLNQIMVTRGMVSENSGNVHWSIAPLVNNPGLGSALLKGPYKKQALVPPSPWVDNQPPAIPVVNSDMVGEEIQLSWETKKNDDGLRHIVYFQYGNSWDYNIISSNTDSFILGTYILNSAKISQTGRDEIENISEYISLINQVAVTSVDRSGNESFPALISLSDLQTRISPSPEAVIARYEATINPLTYSPPAEITAMDTEKKIYYLIRCDDMGMSHAVNMAVQKVIETGIPLCVSVMVTCPWYQEAVEILKDYPNVSVGIHLTLNSEWKNYRWGPILDKKAVPSLVDSSGYFYPTPEILYDRVPNLTEIEKEIRAQIEFAVASGLKPDYLDYHMYAAMWREDLRKLVEQLAMEYHLGLSEYFNEKISMITSDAPLTKKTISLIKHIYTLQPGINVQLMHVGTDGPEMQGLIDLNPNGISDVSRHRQQELNCLLNPMLPDILKERGIIPITYRDVIKIVGLENMRRPVDVGY